MTIKEYNTSLAPGQLKIPHRFVRWSVEKGVPNLSHSSYFPEIMTTILFKIELNGEVLSLVSIGYTSEKSAIRNRMKLWLLENNVYHSEFLVTYTNSNEPIVREVK